VVASLGRAPLVPALNAELCMRNAWLSAAAIALTVTACAHAPVQTGVAASTANFHTARLANDQSTALYVVDGVIINDQSLTPSTPHAVPIYMIDGVPVASPTP
jgi:hypothetical protein